MFPDGKGPFRVLLEMAWLVCAASVLLWLAVQVLTQIWVWLVAAAAVAGLVSFLVVVHRVRRNRW